MSDNPSSPRSSLDGYQSGPIPQFDFHLRVLADSYLSFFQERKRIEESYIDSLNRLHRKVKAIDAFLDDRVELTSARKAWSEVRDNVERESQARQAFLNTLSLDVLNPLIALRESQDRSRKKIKEDLKESAAAHNEFIENQLPKLKRAYLRKCQEMEDYKSSPTVVSPTAGQQPSFQDPSVAYGTSKSNPLGKPITSPQPLRPLERRASASAPSTRNRSPSTSGALSDLAHQGKRQLNQLMTFLDKTAAAKDGMGGRSTENSLRSVRAKREADEADKEYRKAVHWNETLRLRRVKILESAYNSLERFLLEGADTVKRVLVKYTDNMIATYTTQTQLSTHSRSMVEKISPEHDTSLLCAHIPRSLAIATPKPILYYNYQVGECRDLIFGVTMADYATARALGDSDIPKIIRLSIQEIDRRGLDSEGIYRVSGRHAIVQELQHKIERDEAGFDFNPVTDDVYSIASLLKLYLRELPEPVFRFPLQERIQHSEDISDHTNSNFVVLRSKIRRLPPIHKASLRAIVEHLSRVAAHQEKNKMDPKNLAIVFGTVIFGEDEMPPGADLLSLQTWKDSLMEDLITNAGVLFVDEQPAPSSPPLPPAPAGEPTPVYNYGSSHTRVASLPSESAPSRQQTTSDFAPQLPPRPANSIHPSARGNNAMSPPKSTTELPHSHGLRRGPHREGRERPFKLSTSSSDRKSSRSPSVPSTPTTPSSATHASATEPGTDDHTPRAGDPPEHA
ncbi:RhoGAP-domain-containing protein [Dentipellis sp. KUC8613]|nr:RhoGAP-domain-containing protein [Dentipellis sp. KUC8613]